MSEQETNNKQEPVFISHNLWDTEGLPRGPRRHQTPENAPQGKDDPAADISSMKREISELQTAVMLAKGDGAVLVAMRQRIQELEEKIQAKAAAKPEEHVSVWTPVSMTRGRTRR